MKPLSMRAAATVAGASLVLVSIAGAGPADEEPAARGCGARVVLRGCVGDGAAGDECSPQFTASHAVRRAPEQAEAGRATLCLVASDDSLCAGAFVVASLTRGDGKASAGPVGGESLVRIVAAEGDVVRIEARLIEAPSGKSCARAGALRFVLTEAREE